MTNAQEYKPIVEEMIDLMNRQKKLSLVLLDKVKKSDRDEEFYKIGRVVEDAGVKIRGDFFND